MTPGLLRSTATATAVATRSEAAPRADLQIRRATDDDWPRLWPIWHEVVAAGDTYAYDPDTSFADARGSWLGGQPEHETWLAETSDTGAALGMYHISPNQEGPGAHVANGSYMVASSARGAGVGRALVEHSLRRCAELGFRAIQFNAVAETNTGAIALYERLGFSTIGIVPEAFAHPQLGFVGLRVMHRFIP
jgi:ribosomal protein S18 acetylase RimI-like enzyme